MAFKTVTTDRAPQAIGPYSQAAVLGGPSAVQGLVFCSGQLGVDPQTGQFAGPDAVSQARQALSNLGEVLSAAGTTPQGVLKTTVFLVDLEDFQQVNVVYAEFFGDHRPARSTVQVARLPRDARVEIEALAVVL
jgi:2-iminobutanoate/2-iminopropanoate deaminase